jgi:hypothetical protein
MKTAVEWYNEEINKLNVGNDARVFIAKLFEQAKEMEKEQMIELWNIAVTCESFEQYYNETFNK